MAKSKSTRALERKPTARQMLKARTHLERAGGMPTFDTLLWRLRVAFCKLDVVIEAHYDSALSNLDDDRVGAAVILSDVAEEIECVHTELSHWKHARRLVLEPLQRIGTAGSDARGPQS